MRQLRKESACVFLPLQALARKLYDLGGRIELQNIANLFFECFPYVCPEPVLAK